MYCSPSPEDLNVCSLLDDELKHDPSGVECRNQHRSDLIRLCVLIRMIRHAMA